MPVPIEQALRKSLLGTWRQINELDWTDSAFALEKAHVCSLFAQLSYMHLPQYELAERSRFKVVPCEAYQRLASGGQASNIEEVLRTVDFGQSFVVARRYLVVVGVRTPKVMLVAIRGTAYLYDWLLNLNVGHHTVQQSDGPLRFHRGFYKEAMSALPALRERLIQVAGDGVPIYLTGHSLGGAVAAVLHSLWNQRIPSVGYARFGTEPDFQIALPVSYTFGMPRYADINTVVALRTPYHIYNDQDIVPTVPPSWLGYASCMTEFMADGTALEQRSSREAIAFGAWIARLVTGVGVKHHSMELYIDRIAQHVPAKIGT